MRRQLFVTAAVASLSATLSAVPVVAAPAVTIVADTNRDGTADVYGDRAGRAEWTAWRGAVFLPNLDDDSRRCTTDGIDLNDPKIEIDNRLAACNDGADDVVNGNADAADLAPLRTAPTRGTQARVALEAGQEAHARLFVRRDGAWVSLGAGGDLTQSEIRDGAALALEGRDVVRDRAVWDGDVTVTLTVDGSTDRARLRVAPVVLQSDLRPAQTVLTSQPSEQFSEGYPEFKTALDKAAASTGTPVRTLRTDDRWIQDIVEPATVSAPGVAGRPQVMRILLRSANYGRHNSGPVLRPAGRTLFTDLRGPDVGVVQQYTAQRLGTVDDSLNSTGNFDSLPLDPAHPMGRALYGSTPERQPDPSYVKMLHAQYGADPVVLDTSWLAVGHVDETTHVIPAATPRGWTIMVADPRGAVDLMRAAVKAGHGSARLLVNTPQGARTIDEVLADATLMADNETSAKAIDGQIETLTKATGLSQAELVRVPVLFEGLTLGTLSAKAASGRVANPEALAERMHKSAAGEKYMLAYTASIPNGITLAPDVLAAPEPRGPVVAGVDLFKQEAERVASAHGVRLAWTENWVFLHQYWGEVHCGTNALRTPTRAAWWRG